MARRCVFVLTDGSGHSGRSRIARTTALLDRAGAERGCIYGRFTDREIYSAILGKNYRLFIDLAEELARALVRGGFGYVVGDAAEGYNPAHDVCRGVIDAAVELARTELGASLLSYDFLLAGEVEKLPAEMRESMISVELNDDQLSQKLEAAHSYDELGADVNEILRLGGVESIRTEWLRPAARMPLDEGLNAEPPFYERYGEKQVAAGHYQTVLRYREHFLPLASELRKHVGCKG